MGNRYVMGERLRIDGRKVRKGYGRGRVTERRVCERQDTVRGGAQRTNKEEVTIPNVRGIDHCESRGEAEQVWEKKG